VRVLILGMTQHLNLNLLLLHIVQLCLFGTPNRRTSLRSTMVLTHLIVRVPVILETVSSRIVLLM